MLLYCYISTKGSLTAKERTSVFDDVRYTIVAGDDPGTFRIEQTSRDGSRLSSAAVTLAGSSIVGNASHAERRDDATRHQPINVKRRDDVTRRQPIDVKHGDDATRRQPIDVKSGDDATKRQPIDVKRGDDVLSRRRRQAGTPCRPPGFDGGRAGRLRVEARCDGGLVKVNELNYLLATSIIRLD